jgi:hypothetical protein
VPISLSCLCGPSSGIITIQDSSLGRLLVLVAWSRLSSKPSEAREGKRGEHDIATGTFAKA